MRVMLSWQCTVDHRQNLYSPWSIADDFEAHAESPSPCHLHLREHSAACKKLERSSGSSTEQMRRGSGSEFSQFISGASPRNPWPRAWL